MECFRFPLGNLPIRYFGIPIITTKLRVNDCAALVESVEARIRSWASRFLSFAGRLQLIHSILSNIHIFWSSHLILPKSVLNNVEQKLRAFLWTGAELRTVGAKVSWKEVCLPKQEGGLGVKDLKAWNKALMLRHFWHLIFDESNI